MKNLLAKILNHFDLIICRCTNEPAMPFKERKETPKQKMFMQQITKGQQDVST